MINVVLISLCLIQNGYGQFVADNMIPNCPNAFPVACDPSARYSQIDGSCNNLRAPWAGRASTPYKRYLPAAYDDGVNTPRIRSANRVNGLPNPRVVSRMVSSSNVLQFENFFSHLLPAFGQFMAHDMTLASFSTDQNGFVRDCPCGSTLADCMSIVMPSNDNIMRMSCMKFTRTQPTFNRFNCDAINVRREQLNSLSAFLDGSQIYGIDINRNRELREFQGGLMKISQGVFMSRNYMPLSRSEVCGENFRPCFLGGETRTNENLGLTSLQTLFLREHNRLAAEFVSANPQFKFNDEFVFQETRKIVIGIYQNIIYREWIPTVISPSFASIAGLIPSSRDEYYGGYNPNKYPAISNEFASAAFRFGHTLVRQQFGRFGPSGFPMASPINLNNMIFRNTDAYDTASGGIDSLFLGLINEAASKYDSNIADTMQNHLFEFVKPDGSVDAIDLLAMNINRGRDHGIPSFTEIRKLCGLGDTTTFDSLSGQMSPQSINTLRQIYSDVRDIDLYVGGLMENPIPGGAIGPTFSCVLANQFKDLKDTDRFYFETGQFNSSFSMTQLREIKKVSMARIICNNFDVGSIQPNAFLLSNAPGNGRVNCGSIPKLDITAWRF